MESGPGKRALHGRVKAPGRLRFSSRGSPLRPTILFQLKLPHRAVVVGSRSSETTSTSGFFPRDLGQAEPSPQLVR